jgi:hypothetical protein
LETVESIAGSIETLGPAIDKYDIANFARDDFPRFLSLVEHLSPRDQEIILCFAVLQKRPTDLSILFGKAGHRAEEDLHKAAHKLAGLIEFGPSPEITSLDGILSRQQLDGFGHNHFAACLWEYSRTRDFGHLSRLIGQRGLRQQMLRAFKVLHASEGREEGLLAGWILWLVDGSDPQGKGWRKRKRGSREHKLGPTVFRSDAVPYGCEPDHKNNTNPLRYRSESTTMPIPPADGRGGRRQKAAFVKIRRHMKFLLRGMAT